MGTGNDALTIEKIAVSRRWVMERLRSAGVRNAPFWAQRAFAKGTANIPGHKSGIIHNAIHNHAIETNDVKRISHFAKMDRATDMLDARNSYRKYGAAVASQHLGLGEPEHTVFTFLHNPDTREILKQRVNYYPHDGRVEFNGDPEVVGSTKDIHTRRNYTIGGGLTGGLYGALQGAVETKSPVGALIGATITGLGGAGVGYLLGGPAENNAIVARMKNIANGIR